jgi:hypothetical protein
LKLLILSTIICVINITISIIVQIINIKNIIICGINIFIFIIIKRNNIHFFVVQTINIKNIIIWGTKIIMFIIVESINTKKHYYFCPGATSGLTLSPRNKASCPTPHGGGSDPAKGQAAQAPGVHTWGRGHGSHPGQGKPAPLGARA